MKKFLYNKDPPGKTGGISFSGKTLNITGDAQVRFRLACQPCICYVHPAEAGLNQSPPFTQGGTNKALLKKYQKDLTIKKEGYIIKV